MSRPYTLRIFVPRGEPDGLRTIEKSNWNGSGIVIPRALLTDTGDVPTPKEVQDT